jgi:hypothetical protein
VARGTTAAQGQRALESKRTMKSNLTEESQRGVEGAVESNTALERKRWARVIAAGLTAWGCIAGAFGRLPYDGPTVAK